mgnify:CR=1 FL=1
MKNYLLLPVGRMKDVMITGYRQSDLDDFVEKTASAQGRYVINDPNSRTGMYFRSDHFAFATNGVPSLYARGNIDNPEFGKEWKAESEFKQLRNK